MSVRTTRRRFLAIAAASLCAAPAYAATTARWQGYALGASTSMQLAGVSATRAAPVFRAVELELTRLENIFSLYRATSQLSQLNATGYLDTPAPELLEVLTLCDAIYTATDGAFDPTVQPLWMALATGSKDKIDHARELVGWQKVRFNTRGVELAKPGMGLTLNGVAQGYVTDRIADLLGARGFGDVLIDMGEIAAKGRRADGQPWQAGVALPDGALIHRVSLSDKALATSSPMGTVLDDNTGVGHILDPRRDPGAADAKPPRQLISISANRASVADGLSTACCLLAEDGVHAALAHFPETTLEALI